MTTAKALGRSILEVLGIPADAYQQMKMGTFVFNFLQVVPINQAVTFYSDDPDAGDGTHVFELMAVEEEEVEGRAGTCGGNSAAPHQAAGN